MASRACAGVAVVGRKNEHPRSNRSHWIKYSAPQSERTRTSSGIRGFGFSGIGLGADVFRLRERRFVDANYVSIKDVAAHCDTAKPTNSSRTNTSGV